MNRYKLRTRWVTKMDQRIHAGDHLYCHSIMPVEVRRPNCWCGSDHIPVAAYGVWCCPTALFGAQQNQGVS